MRNLFENIVTNQSKCVAHLTNPTDQEMTTITNADLPAVVHDVPVNLQSSITKPTQSPVTPLPDEKEEENEPEFVGEYHFDWNNLPNITFADILCLSTAFRIFGTNLRYGAIQF